MNIGYDDNAGLQIDNTLISDDLLNSDNDNTTQLQDLDEQLNFDLNN
jgi:hypothetical protein